MFQVVPVGVEIAIAFAIMASAHVCHFTWLKMPQPVFQVGFEKKVIKEYDCLIPLTVLL